MKSKLRSIINVIHMTYVTDTCTRSGVSNLGSAVLPIILNPDIQQVCCVDQTILINLARHERDKALLLNPLSCVYLRK